MRKLVAVLTIGFWAVSLTALSVRASDDHDHLHGNVLGRDYSGPVVFVAKRSVDLGEVREGQKPQATFLIQNQGAKDLIIEDVHATCGCTTVELSEEERIVKPQESREIVAIFDSTGRIGKQRKPIVVTVNDPSDPQVTLTLVANVVSLFKVVPAPLVHLRSARRGVELPPLDAYPVDPNTSFESIEINVPEDILEYRKEEISDDSNGQGVRFVFKVPEHTELGTMSGNMMLEAVVAGEKAKMPIRVTGTVVGDLMARPAMLQALNPVPRGHGFATVTVAATNDRPFEVISASAGPYIEVAVEPQTQKKVYMVRARIRDNAPDGPIGTNLVIHTDNSGQPVLEVPVFANVRPRYQVEPPIALLGPQSGRIRRIGLRADRTSAFNISGVSCDHPMVGGELLEVEQGQMTGVQFIRVGIRSGQTPTEDISTEVVVQTDLPGAEEIRIPVVYRMGS